MTVTAGCHKLPAPDFSIEPSRNPEAGDTIRFVNESKHARTYLWEFGDGTSSTRESPLHIFGAAGIYAIRLTASSNTGSDFISRPVTINEPTILSFITYDSARENLLTEVEILVYTNESDRDRGSDPLVSGITDSLGVAEFMNLEAEVYHVSCSKAVQGGSWRYKGYTSRLELNAVNRYVVPMQWSTGVSP